jgi:protein-tyrosine phosphatase
MFTVLAVCTGNLNRSALAEALLRTWAGWYLPASVASQVNVTSAGLSAPVGSHMRTRTRTIAATLGADGSGHRAVQLGEAMVRDADLVLVAEAAQRDLVLGFAPGALKRTLTIREAGAIAARIEASSPPATLDELRSRASAITGGRALATGIEADIVDPQGKEDDAYREMTRQEVPALARLAAALFGMPDREVEAYEATAADPAAFPFGADAPSAPASDGSQGRHRA